MPTVRISKRSVDDCQPGERVIFLWDDQVRGFGLRVTPAGARSYVFQYRLGGRESPAKRYTIGAHGKWTPDLARDEAKRLARLVSQGIDPGHQRSTARREAVELGFAGYVERFADGYLKDRWARPDEAKRMLVREAVPVIGGKPLPAITRADINAVLDRAADRPAVVRHLHATLRKMFRWAVSRGDLERSPMEGMEAPKPLPARDRVLEDDELQSIWLACDDVIASFGAIVRLLILTGQRREEVGGLHWGELDRAAALWTLPGTRAKNGVAHLVPLSTLAITILDGVAGGDKWPRSGLVFPTGGKGSFSAWSKSKAALDAAISKRAWQAAGSPPDQQDDYAIKPWRLHDLRRTVATGLQRLGVRFEVTEAVLNHVSGAKGGVAGVYQRHDWAPEKRAALVEWGIKIERLVTSNG